MTGLMTKGIGTLALILSLMGTKMTTAYTSLDASKRWTEDSGTDYETTETYTDVQGNEEEYRMQWELYEGSIALVQMALVWKEIMVADYDTGDNFMIARTTGSEKTEEMLRIRRIWQLENCQASYQDEFELGAEQLENNFANMEYSNPSPQNGNEWFMGDVVPFERCAYIVNMNSDGTDAFFNFHRLQTAIKWDPILKIKKVVTQVDHTSPTQTLALGSSNNLSFIPNYVVEIGYWPHKGAFFYFNRGYMFLIHDPEADTQDFCECPPDPNVAVPSTACELTQNLCDTSRMIDPCARDTPLFNNGANAVFQTPIEVQTSGTGKNWKANNAIAFEIVFDSVFVIWNKSDEAIWRVGGKTYDTLHASEFYILSAGASNAVPTNNWAGRSGLVADNTIQTICSMDFHGLFLGIKNSDRVVRLELDIKNDDADVSPAVEYDGNGVLVVETVKYFEMATTDTFRLLQTKGYYSRHRPCYLVASDNATQLQRLSTLIKPFFPDPVVPDLNPIDLYTTDWSEGVVPQGAQLLRFHLFGSMPGIVDDSVSLADLDYDHIKAVIYDIRAKEEWGKFALTTSGDGEVNPELGEECDPSRLPPQDFYYDVNCDVIKGSACTYLEAAYPDADVQPTNHANGSNASADNKVSWIAADTVLDLSGDIERPSEYFAAGYYYCSSASFLEPYTYCGDGVASNGPPELTAFNQLHDANQRSGILGLEVCDDGNLSGDGCADDCLSITDGWECLEWGVACTLKCGNGHVEGALGQDTDAFGNLVFNTILSTDAGTGEITYDTTSGFTSVFVHELNQAGDAVREECDFGAYNSPRDLASTTYDDVYSYACTSDCMFTENKYIDDPSAAEKDYKKWECTISVTPTDWHQPNNQEQVVHYQTCNYLCGNRILEWDTGYGETCDLGGWSHLSMDTNGYHDKADGVDFDTGTYPITDHDDIQSWIDTQSDPAGNGDLAVGCTSDCRAYQQEREDIPGQYHFFVFDDTNFDQLGSDRCGDGIMDGPIVRTNGTDTITLQGTLLTSDYSVDPQIWRTQVITGYVPYYEVEYSARMLPEYCDNGGDHDHGCDRLCRITAGWECWEYYHHLVGLENPYFTSVCSEIANPDLDYQVRRLSPDDFDKHGRRKLHHLPRKAYLVHLPDNNHVMRAGKHTLMFEPKSGLNGQVRVIESTECANCFGFAMAYMKDEATLADWFYYQTSDSASTVTETTVLMTANSNAQQGKQRNTFGAYMIVNKDYDQIEIWGYAKTATPSFTLLKTTVAEASVEYIGSHEYHWFPHKNLLMAKLSDGSSFRFYRMTSDFRTYATDTTSATKYLVDSGEFRLFHVPGRTMVPPIFWGRWAYFYISSIDSTDNPKLVAYYWNELSLEFEEKCTKDMDAENTNTNNYHKYTMVNVGDDGIIFNKFGGATFKNYVCGASAPTFTETTVSENNGLGAYTGVQGDISDISWNWALVTLIQAREDPDNWVAGTYPDIYALHNSGYIQKMTWATPTLTLTADYITVPIDHAITVSPEHLDVGRQQLVILSPSQCAAEADTTVITNAAVYFYALNGNTDKDWVCRDLTSLQPSTLIPDMNLTSLDPLAVTDEGRMDTGASHLSTYWEHNAYR